MRNSRMRPTAGPKVRLNKDGRPREAFEGLRDEDKRAWIRQQPCAVASEKCRYTRTSAGFVSDVEHVENKARGLGDDATIPLCHGHHMERHQYGPKSCEKAWGVKFAELVGTYQVAYEKARGLSL